MTMSSFTSIGPRTRK